MPIDSFVQPGAFGPEMAFRETWTPAAGRALVWHPLYSRHTPNQRAPFDRGNCGLSPPTGRPTAPRQPRPNPKPAPRPLQPPSRRATSGEPPAAPRVPVCHGRPGQWRPGRGLRDGARAACTHGAGGDFAPARELKIWQYSTARCFRCLEHLVAPPSRTPDRQKGSSPRPFLFAAHSRWRRPLCARPANAYHRARLAHGGTVSVLCSLGARLSPTSVAVRRSRLPPTAVPGSRAA